MRRSIATVSLSGTLRQKLQAIAAARFDGIELFEADFVNFDGSAADLRAMAADLGLSIDLYQPFRDFEGMPDADHARNCDRAERKFDLMQALGAPTMLVCSNTSERSLGDPQRSAAQLHELAERAARRTCASATKRSRGAATSTATARRGRSSSAPTIRTWG